MIRRTFRIALLPVALGAVVALGAAPGGAAPTASSTPPTTAATPGPTVLPVGDRVVTGGITREVLASVAPPNAPGTALYLTRVRIAPGSPLPEHFHDGTQLARVIEGTLTYEVVSGVAAVDRADGTRDSYTGPKTLKLRPGDVVTEYPGMVHRGRNATKTPVVTETTALIEATAGLSTPVGAGATGTTVTTGTFELVVDTKSLTTAGPGGDRSYGTVVEHGTTTVGGDPVRVDLTVQVDYTNGRGPWTGMITLTWPDGSTVGGTMAGATIPTADGGAAFAATIGVVGGSGRYAAVTGGSGTYAGSRAGSIGATPLMVELGLTLTGV